MPQFTAREKKSCPAVDAETFHISLKCHGVGVVSLGQAEAFDGGSGFTF
jgi:hypothetical protein